MAIPGGHIEPCEDPAQAAIREVMEETGIEVEIVAEERLRHEAVQMQRARTGRAIAPRVAVF